MQTKALDDSVYLSMTDEEATKYKERAKRLKQLRREFMSLLKDNSRAWGV